MHRALFLDRDGVVNIEKNYLYKKEDVDFIEGIFPLCKHYQSLGYLIFIVTNQSGIARNYYSEHDFMKLSEWMVHQFEKHDILISKVYFCPHHPEISGICTCRKPNPGMLLSAKEEFDLDLHGSIIIGDKERDIEAGLNAGLYETYLFDSEGKTKVSKATKIVTKLDEIWKNKC